jgi:hypothetical protein
LVNIAFVITASAFISFYHLSYLGYPLPTFHPITTGDLSLSGTVPYVAALLHQFYPIPKTHKQFKKEI